MTNQLPPTLNELLGTKNKKEQVKRVSGLMQQINIPVVDLVIRFDGRTNQISVSVVGPDVPIEGIYKLLDSTRDMLRQQELEATKAKESQEPTPAPVRIGIPTKEDNERAKNIR